MIKHFKTNNKEFIINYQYNNEIEEKELEKLNNLLDFCLNTNNLNEVELIKLIRTIFRNHKEKVLEINIKDNERKQNTLIRYENEVLTKFYLDIPVNIKEKEEIFNFEYIIGSGITNSLSNIYHSNIGINLYNELVLETIELKEKFINIEPLILTNSDIELCKYYKLFYGETPDFSNPNINIKFQTMAFFITTVCGIKVANNFELVKYNKIEIPYSKVLASKVSKFLPLGQIKDEEINKNNLENKKIYLLIEEIGKIIKEESNNQDITITLITYNQIFYYNNCRFKKPSLSKINEIAKILNYPPKEVEDTFDKINNARKKRARELYNNKNK